MNQEEIVSYKEHFKMLLDSIEKPDIIIFLRADIEVLIDRIKKRGRDMESGISKDYLNQLQDLYDSKLLPIIEKEYPEIRLLKYDTDLYNENNILEKICEDLGFKMNIGIDKFEKIIESPNNIKKLEV